MKNLNYKLILQATLLAGTLDIIAALIGLLLHYIVAFLFTLFFAIIFKRIWYWFGHKLLIAVIYGVFVWLIMNLIIVPTTQAQQIPFSWSAGLTNCIILIYCFAYPLVFVFRTNMIRASLKEPTKPITTATNNS